MPFFLVIDNFGEEFAGLDPADRWSLFLQPLIAALAEERIGEILDLDEIVQEVDGRKSVVADQITLEVVDMQRTKELIRGIAESIEPPGGAAG